MHVCVFRVNPGNLKVRVRKKTFIDPIPCASFWERSEFYSNPDNFDQNYRNINTYYHSHHGSKKGNLIEKWDKPSRHRKLD